LTGEPESVKKEVVTKENYKNGSVGTLLAKSLVISGMGKAIVVAVGNNTVSGAAAERS
jgi:magnesium-transporting ATPase (P-type)